MWERDAEIYWIAGFLEGEGCFGWYGDHCRSRTHRKKCLGYPSVIASQNLADEDTIGGPHALRRIAAVFPGRVRFQSMTDGWKEHWEYRVNNEPAIDIMVAVFPLMSPRRQSKIVDVVANYADRSVERIHEYLQIGDFEFCPHGHPRNEFGVRRVSGVGKGSLYCRECSRVAAAQKSERKFLIATGVVRDGR